MRPAVLVASAGALATEGNGLRAELRGLEVRLTPKHFTCYVATLRPLLAVSSLVRPKQSHLSWQQALKPQDPPTPSSQPRRVCKELHGCFAKRRFWSGCFVGATHMPPRTVFARIKLSLVPE